MIAGGWICRACWHSNGPTEERCYRCHTPRDQQLTVEAGSLKQQAEPGAELKGRLDADLPILAWLAVVPLRVSAALQIGAGIILFVVGLLVGKVDAPDVLGLQANIFVSLFGLVLILLGFLQVFLANSVRRHARWAYVVTLVLAVSGSVPRMIGISVPALTSDLAITVWWISTWLYFAMAIFAAALLLMSFVRRPIE
jgi:hypothetical protein